MRLAVAYGRQEHWTQVVGSNPTARAASPTPEGVGPKVRTARPDTGPPHRVKLREIQTSFLTSTL